MNPEIKNIIFDLGGVFFRVDKVAVMAALRNLLPPSAQESFPLDYDSFCDEPPVHAFESGQMGPRTFRNWFREVWQCDCTDEAFDEAWNQILAGPDEKMMAKAESLFEGRRVFLLSTNNPIHFEKLNQTMNGFLARFEKCYFSYLTGKRKPDAAAFEQVISENGLVKEETLFVDDSATHVDAAQKLGLKTILFRSESDII